MEQFKDMIENTLLCCELCKVKYSSDLARRALNVPKQLVCFHTFCTGCLHINTKDEGISCPICNVTTILDVSNGGVNLLPNNLTLLTLLDCAGRLSSTPSPKGSSSDHSFFPIEDMSTPAIGALPALSICKCHSQPANHRCVTCLGYVCETCVNSLHVGHQIIHIDGYSAMMLQAAKNTCEMLDQSLANQRDEIMNSEDSLRLLTCEFERRRYEIDVETETVIRQLLADKETKQHALLESFKTCAVPFQAGIGHWTSELHETEQFLSKALKCIEQLTCSGDINLEVLEDTEDIISCLTSRHKQLNANSLVSPPRTVTFAMEPTEGSAGDRDDDDTHVSEIDDSTCTWTIDHGDKNKNKNKNIGSCLKQPSELISPHSSMDITNFSPCVSLERIGYGDGDPDSHNAPVMSIPSALALLELSSSNNTEQLFVVDQGFHNIQVFDALSGQHCRSIGSGRGNQRTNMNHPTHITILKEGNFNTSPLLFVTDRDNNRVQVWNAITGAYVRSIGGATARPCDQLNHPCEAVLFKTKTPGLSAMVYVADSGNNRVQVYNTATGAAVLSVGQGFGNRLGMLSNPMHLVIIPTQDDSGLLFVSDHGNHRVCVFNAITGAFLRVIGSKGSAAGQLKNPTDLLWFALAGKSDVFLAVNDYGNRRIQIFNAKSGSFVRSIGEDLPHAQARTWRASDMLLMSGPPVAHVHSLSHHPHAPLHASPSQARGSSGGSGGAGSGSNIHSNSSSAPDCLLLVSDHKHGRILVFNVANGQYLRTIGDGEGPDMGQLSNPCSLLVREQPDGATVLYVAECSNHRVQAFNVNELAKRST